MLNLIKSEFYILKKDKIYFLLILVSFFLGYILSLDMEHTTAVSTLYSSLYNLPLLLLPANVFGAIYIGKDFPDRTLDRYIYSGHKRIHILLTKLICFIIYATIMLLVQPIICTLISLCTEGWGASTIEVYHVISVILVICLLNMSMFGMTFLIAFLIKDIGKTLVLSTLIYFLMIFLLNSNNALSIAHFLPLGQMRLLVEKRGDLREAVFVGIIYFCFFVGLSIFHFRKCELK